MMVTKTALIIEAIIVKLQEPFVGNQKYFIVFLVFNDLTKKELRLEI